MADLLKIDDRGVPIIGILGGIASGKSTVTRMLEDLGAVVFDADQAGHRALHLPHVKQAIRRRFSDGVFDEAGEIVRSQLARHVFGSEQEHRQALADLEEIVHPEIGQELQQFLQVASQEGAPAIVLDAPVMLKAGWNRHCNHLLFVDCSTEDRWQRASNRGWSRQEFDLRESTQEELPLKRQLATWTIANDGDFERLKSQTFEFWKENIDG